jgi:hypothetical protein
MSNYKYLSDEVVAKIDDDGKSRLSCSVDDEEFKAWLADGNTATAADAIPDPTYQENRVAEYPPVADYLDGIVKADDLQVQKYIDDCQAVKDKYPKE